ncbi:TPA: histidine--tRNA ligase [Candidatus Falkowbacteria bacterium]|nr:histidine--tRNA ligase [Candidatus Falkowbacteria bacterium]
MSKSNLQRAKGVRDFGPAEKIERDRIIETMKKVFESFGFSPIETPIIERYETFASKFAQGEQSDAMKESFKFKDQGRRDLVLRNDFTVPLSRFVSMNSDLPMPFKRYQMGQIFRDGPLKLGRYREFWQCDVDIVGEPNFIDDVEILVVIQSIFKALNLDVTIKLNNRKLLGALLDYYKISKEAQTEFIISLDKIDKIGKTGVLAELKTKNIDASSSESLIDLLSELSVSDITNEEKINKLAGLDGFNSSALEELTQTLAMINQNNISFIPNLARGLAYYTGNVFEVFLTDQSKLSSSLAGGGRYDAMMAEFTGLNLGGVGVGFGLETIFDALNLVGSEPNRQTVTNIYVIPLGQNELKPAMEIASRIRQQGFNVDVDKLDRKMKKKMEYANKLNIPYVAVVGSDELASDSVMLKNMDTGEQKLIKVDNLSTEVKI